MPHRLKDWTIRTLVKYGTWFLPISILLNVVAYTLIGVFGIQVLNLVSVINNERNDRRTSVNTAICDLVDAVPEGNAQIDKTRHDFRCGAYIPPGINELPTPTSTPSPSPGKPTSTPSTKPGAIPIPPGIHLPGSTVTVKVPVRTTVIHTKTRVVRPPLSPPVPIPTQLCRVLPQLC